MVMLIPLNAVIAMKTRAFQVWTAKLEFVWQVFCKGLLSYFGFLCFSFTQVKSSFETMHFTALDLSIMAFDFNSFQTAHTSIQTKKRFCCYSSWQCYLKEISCVSFVFILVLGYVIIYRKWTVLPLVWIPMSSLAGGADAVQGCSHQVNEWNPEWDQGSETVRLGDFLQRQGPGHQTERAQCAAQDGVFGSVVHHGLDQRPFPGRLFLYVWEFY